MQEGFPHILRFDYENLKVMEERGINYVVACKLKTLPKEKKQEILDSKDYKLCSLGFDLFWRKEFEHESRRLVVSYSKKRTHKDKNQRERLINRLMKKARNNQIPVNQLISNHGTKRFIKVDKTKAVIDEEKISKEALWDGLHGIITNIKEKSAQELLERYRGLWRIEEAFRVNKHSLKMRPIYHWKKRRIEAHIAICFLAYAISYTMKHRLHQAGLNLSIDKMRKILIKDQYSVLEEKATQKFYQIPSRNTKEIEAI